MSETLRKRGREPQALGDSIDAAHPKRFCSEETDRFLHLLQLDKTLSEDDDDDCAPSEELVNEVMKSLEEEISATSSTSHHISNSGDNLATDNASRDDPDRTQDSDLGDDICYPWHASQGEPGIPPNPILDLNHEICQSPNRTMDGLLESMDVKSIPENWHLEDDFESYQQFALYEDAWMPASQLQDCIDRDFVSQGMLFDGDISAGWKLETVGAI